MAIDLPSHGAWLESSTSSCLFATRFLKLKSDVKTWSNKREIPSLSNVFTDWFYCKIRIRIGLEGYNTSLEPIDLYWALESLFKTCGEVDDIEIDRDPVTNALKRSCVVILRGEGAGENALQLNGSDIGGRKIVVTSLPPGISVLRSGLSTDVLAARHVAHHQRHR